jgi:Yip1-like protein
MASPVGQQALVDQWERTANEFGRPVDDAAYARMEELSERGGVGYAVVTALVGGPVLTLVVAAALFVAFRGAATFRQVLAVATYSGVILALRQIIAAPIGYLRESTSNATSLGALFSTFDETSSIARFLGALDLFVLWWAVVLAIGVSVLYHRRARNVAVTFVGLYAALALLLAIAMAVTGGSA